MNKFSFKPLTDIDFPLMHAWLNSAHVSSVWDGPQTMEQVRQSYGDANASWVFPHIVFLNNRAIGFIQSYNANLAGGGWWPDEPPGTWGVDQFIGVEDLLGKGIGSEFVREFTDQLLQNTEVKRIITDPDPENARAIRAYEKAGFKKLNIVVTPDGPSLIMEKK